MKQTKKILAPLLAVCLLIGCLPISASAQTNTVQPIDNSVSTQASDEAFIRATFTQYVVNTLVGADLTNYTPDSGATLSDVTADHANYKAMGLDKTTNYFSEHSWMCDVLLVYEPDENGDPVACELDRSFEYALNGMTGELYIREKCVENLCFTRCDLCQNTLLQYLFSHAHR